MANPVTEFFGSAVGEGSGEAIGTATGAAVEPALEQFANTMREHFRHYRLEPQDAAALRAREQLPGEPFGIDLGNIDPHHEARYGGFRQERFDVLTELAREEPSESEWRTLRRRGVISNDASGITRASYRNALRRHGHTFEVIDSLTELLDDWLAPADVANAVQQSFLPNEGLLPEYTKPDPPFDPPAEQVDLPPTHEAFNAGINEQRLRVLAQLAGNPPSPEQLAEMVLRKEIPYSAAVQGLREGRTKNKWATAVLYYLMNPLLTPGVLVNRRLKGWDTDAEFHTKMALHGFTGQQSQDWFEAEGRPSTVHQAIVGFRRGARVPGLAATEDAHVAAAVERSDIRPEWQDVAHQANLTYPSAFVLRRLVMDGAFTAAEASDVLFESGWRRDYANHAANSWANQGSAAEPHVARAETQLWTTQHTSYKAGESTATEAETTFGLLNIPQTSHPRILALWDRERELVRKTLTPAQIKKAWKEPAINAATGVAWTTDEAIAALVALGYSTVGAQDFLAI